MLTRPRTIVLNLKPIALGRSSNLEPLGSEDRCWIELSRTSVAERVGVNRRVARRFLHVICKQRLRQKSRPPSRPSWRWEWWPWMLRHYQSAPIRPSLLLLISWAVQTKTCSKLVVSLVEPVVGRPARADRAIDLGRPGWHGHGVDRIAGERQAPAANARDGGAERRALRLGWTRIGSARMSP